MKLFMMSLVCGRTNDTGTTPLSGFLSSPVFKTMPQPLRRKRRKQMVFISPNPTLIFSHLLEEKSKRKCYVPG